MQLKARFGFLLFITLIPAGMLRLYAQITVSATVPKKDYLVGDRIPVQLTVKHPKGYTFSWPLISNNLTGLELSDSVIINHDTTVQDTVISSKTINLAAFDSGTYTYPAQPFIFQKAGDTTHLRILSDPVSVHVNVVTVDTTKEIKPIKGPIQVSTGINWATWVFVLALLLLAAAIYFFRNRRKAPIPLHPQAAPALPPKDEALAALKQLEDEKLYDKGEYKQHYFRLTEIMRKFLSGTYQFRAQEMTTKRIIKKSEKYLQNPSLQAQLSGLLLTADLIKFAKMQPTPEESLESLHIARNIVSMARTNETSTDRETSAL